MEFITALLSATIRTTTPILLIALGGAFATKGGVFNVSLEGTTLLAAFAATVFSIYTESAGIGLAAGILTALLVAGVFGFLVITLRTNEIVTGLGINILAGGATIALMKSLFGARGIVFSHKLKLFPVLDIPLINQIPFLKEVVNGHTPFVYLSVLFILIVYIIFFKTKLGLYIRVAGEYEAAGESLGINMKLIRYIAILICGLFCGIAGSHLALGYINLFAENMTSGRGFMAVAALIFSSGNPVSLTISCVIFGFFDALSIRLQGGAVSSYLILCIPYIVVLLFNFLIGFMRRPRHFKDTAESIKSID